MRWTVELTGLLLFFLFVAPGRRPRTGDDAGDVGIFAARGRGLVHVALALFQPTRRLLLLFFLARAFACALVLGRSGLLHDASSGVGTLPAGFATARSAAAATGSAAAIALRFGTRL